MEIHSNVYDILYIYSLLLAVCRLFRKRKLILCFVALMTKLIISL